MGGTVIRLALVAVPAVAAGILYYMWRALAAFRDGRVGPDS